MAIALSGLCAAPQICVHVVDIEAVYVLKKEPRLMTNSWNLQLNHL